MLPQPKRSEALSDLAGCRVEVLDCSTLPTGTHKILKAERALLAVNNDRRPAILISSGNYARAVKYLAEIQRRRVIIVMGGGGSARQELDSEFVETVDIKALIAAYASAIQKYYKLPEKDLLGCGLQFAYNAFKGRGLLDNTVVNITNRDDIEFAEEYRVNGPFYKGFNDSGYSKVFCPNGSGELLYSLVEQGAGSTEFCGVSPENHPAISGEEFTSRTFAPSLADKLTTPTFPLEHTHISWVRGRRKISFSAITEEEIAQTQEIALSCGLNSEPSASVSLAFLLESFRERCGMTIDGSEKILAVLTGNGRDGL